MHFIPFVDSILCYIYIYIFIYLLWRAEGHPPPNTYYVDQVKNTLHQIESMDIPSVCEARYSA